MNNKSNAHASIKHERISRTNSKIVLLVTVATFIVVFCAFASRALFSQGAYHNRIISEKKIALNQLKSNEESIKELAVSYDSFSTQPINVIGGNPEGQGPNDGGNLKIMEDALPSKYDFPALTSSFEKIIKSVGVQSKSIGGQEDPELSKTTEPTESATALEIPYSLAVSGPQDKIQLLLDTLERSIRPMSITSVQIQIAGQTLDTRIQLKTYYTQEGAFVLGSKEVK
jgi:hypothetical protein